ncbi:hypothetical protein FYJ66_08010 [Clostridiales Family XIII bacterium RF-744-FAT-WT-3]|uniref:Type VII secretion system protein EssD-like domain-containing protein n=1 Tax=Baileyella intestinalis TaxID=2606709 RepID=A0A6A8MD19_9FIRM|nr:DNA/RNA non-specific endonuclease [Baileyella intestinalis]MST69526.1 hypothetical protein [Baileyella intestinalis]
MKFNIHGGTSATNKIFPGGFKAPGRAFKRVAVLCMAALLAVSAAGCSVSSGSSSRNSLSGSQEKSSFSTAQSMSAVPDYQDGQPMVVVLNENHAGFSESEKAKRRSYVSYNPLDSLGRATGAEVIEESSELPSGKRGSISEVHPSGWKSASFPGLVPGGSFYNRAHLIAWSISGIDGSSVFAERDLVTATRTCNTEMIPYESQVVDYLKNNPGKHVIYRVTADYHGEEPVCRGIHMEGFSLEDRGSLDFNVYIYNVQPGFSIDYSTGNMRLTSKAWAEEFTKTGNLQESWEAAGGSTEGSSGNAPASSGSSGEKQDSSGGSSESSQYFVINTSSGIIHQPDCSSVRKMADHNKKISHQSLSDLESQGYKPCKICLA